MFVVGDLSKAELLCDQLWREILVSATSKARIPLGTRSGAFYATLWHRTSIRFEPHPNRKHMDDSSKSSNTQDKPASLVARVMTYVSLAVVGAGLDLWSKHAIFAWRGVPGQKDIWWIIEGYFGIETSVNLGAVFGIGQGQGSVFAALSVFAMIGIIAWLFWFGAAQSLWLTVALGMITGGIIGNLYDRLGMWWQEGYPPEWKSGVRDWILWQASDKWVWPNFNIADSLLVCGAGMLLWQSFFLVDEQEEDAGKSEE